MSCRRVHGAVAAAAGHGLSDDMNNELAGLVGQRTNFLTLANCQFIVACMHEDDIVLLDRALLQYDLLRGGEPPQTALRRCPRCADGTGPVWVMRWQVGQGCVSRGVEPIRVGKLRGLSRRMRPSVDGFGIITPGNQPGIANSPTV